jgi:hypothetical protein
LIGNGGGGQTLEEESTRDCDSVTQGREGQFYTDRDWKGQGRGEHAHHKFTLGNCDNKPRGGCERKTKVGVENLARS